MKKQILILFIMLFAGIATTYGQTITPRAITDLDHDALSPIPGQPYTYTVNVPTPPGDRTYQWFVTQHLNFIEARDDATFRELIGGNLLAAGDIEGDGFFTETKPDSDPDSELSLTWKSFSLDPDEYLFVVIYVQNADGEVCTSDNLKVYRIEPQHAFTLDIANMGFGSDYGTDIDICPDDVQTAEFNTTTMEVDFTFGEDTLEYEVVAANFHGSYELHVQFSGEHTDQDVTLEWSRTDDFATVTEVQLTDGAGDVVIEAAGGTEASVGEDGEVIYIRAIITHNNYEGIADRTFTLAINGYTNGMEEIYHVTGEPDGFENDVALQTITARPNITPVDPDQFLDDNASN